MAQLSGYRQIYHNDTLSVDTSRQVELGTRAIDENGNEYIYLQGVAGVVARDWITFNNSDFIVTRLIPDAVGPVAIAATAIVANEFGWFQVFGISQARTDTISANSQLYVDATTGRADDLSVSGDAIIGARSITADSSNIATVSITYPYVTNDLGGAAGGISGPTLSTDNAVARWNGIAGDTLQNSSVTISDTGDLLMQGSLGTATINTINLTADRTISLPDATGTVYVTGGTDVAVADGGTGSSTAAGARTNLGLVIGTDVQAFDNDLSDLAALSHSASAMIVSDGTDWLSKTPTQVRTDLGLVIGTNVQAWDTDLDGLAGISANGMIARTGAGTFAARTITGVGAISVTNGDGVSAAPSIEVGTATLTGTGVVELATAAETTTGTDTVRAITPDGFAGSNYGSRVMQIIMTDPNGTQVSGGTGTSFVRVNSVMNNWNLIAAAAHVVGTVTTAGIPIVLRNMTDSVNMFSTNLWIDVNERDSSTSQTAVVIDAAVDDVATADELRIAVDTTTGTALGLIVELTFQTP